MQVLANFCSERWCFAFPCQRDSLGELLVLTPQDPNGGSFKQKMGLKVVCFLGKYLPTITPILRM